jgi:ubiquinone biosynthesis protein COQ4
MSQSDSLSPSTYRYQPRRALTALRTLLADPNDTAQVFTIIEALSGPAPLRLLERFRASSSGRRLLASRANILPVLADRAALEAMPKGSLAEAYLAFLDHEGITPDGLVDASAQGEIGDWRNGGDFDYVNDRLRDTHDLWHAVTGYRGDVLGEAALLAFSAAQTKNLGVTLIALAAIGKSRDLGVARSVARAYFEGRRAEWLPAVEWETLLPLPLADVQARLRITPVATYVRMRSDWVRESAPSLAA